MSSVNGYEKLAVVTLVTSPEWQKLAELTLPSQRQYANRVGADFVVLDQRVSAHAHYDKWQIYDLFSTYDRILYLDADMIVRPDCPDLFVCVPTECVGGENELLSFPGQAQHLQRLCQRLGIGPLPCSFYLNAGMFVASAQHRSVFRAPEKVCADLDWPEQSHFNARLIGEKHRICFLPPAFNDRRRKGDYLRQSYILHYSTMSVENRINAVRRDLHAWDLLFRREPLPRPALPATSAAAIFGARLRFGWIPHRRLGALFHEHDRGQKSRLFMEVSSPRDSAPLVCGSAQAETNLAVGMWAKNPQAKTCRR